MPVHCTPRTATKAWFILDLLLHPWVITTIVASFLVWMLAMTRLEVSYAFPFMGFNYVLILFGSALLFGESLTTAKMTGILLVVSGIVVLA